MNTLEQKLEHVISCRGLISRRNIHYEVKVTRLPSLFHWHCSRPMIRLFVLKHTKQCEYVITHIRHANEYICRNPSCYYHITEFNSYFL